MDRRRPGGWEKIAPLFVVCAAARCLCCRVAVRRARSAPSVSTQGEPRRPVARSKPGGRVARAKTEERGQGRKPEGGGKREKRKKRRSVILEYDRPAQASVARPYNRMTGARG